MMIDGNVSPPEHPDRTKPQRPTAAERGRGTADRATAASARDTGAPTDAANAAQANLHRTEALREAAARLLDEGGIDTSLDGMVRPSRVDLARQKYAAGAFNRREVLTRIVDRLIEQWQI